MECVFDVLTLQFNYAKIVLKERKSIYKAI